MGGGVSRPSETRRARRVREAEPGLMQRAEGELRADRFRLHAPDNVWRLCCRADRAPGAAPTVFALGFKRLRRARGPRPGQYQPLVVWPCV
jgi:hypothetical protein